MREFFFKDKNSNTIIRGFAPHNDIDCDPFEYFRLGYAFSMFRNNSDLLSLKGVDVPEEVIKTCTLNKVDMIINDILESSQPNPAIHQLLTDESLKKQQQLKLLKGLTLKADDLLWLNKEAHDLGYLLDVYHEEIYPDKFKDQQMPYMIHQKEDGKIEFAGKTNMTEGDMKTILEQRRAIQARIFHKDNIWHCFHFTVKGLYGLEGGTWGAKPHYHYLSDKSGLSWEELIQRVKSCDLPSSSVHVVIDRG